MWDSSDPDSTTGGRRSNFSAAAPRRTLAAVISPVSWTVAALLADSVELVEEQYARGRSGVIEDTLEPRGSLSKKAPDQSLVPDDEEGHRQRFGDRLGKGGLPVPRRADEQDAMPWFEGMCAQHGSPVLFLDQLLAGPAGKVGQDEIGQPLAGRQLDQELPLLRAGTG